MARGELRPLMEAAKHHFVVAFGIDHWADPVGHQAAALPASVAIWRMAEAVCAEPGNANLPDRAVYNYILNRMFADLTAPIATEQQRQQVYLSVHLQPGRPPTRRPRARQALIDEIRARPDIADYLIKDRALTLGVWTIDQADDAANVRRRMRRLREDAAN